MIEITVLMGDATFSEAMQSALEALRERCTEKRVKVVGRPRTRIWTATPDTPGPLSDHDRLLVLSAHTRPAED